jgi:hypothetical protein
MRTVLVLLLLANLTLFGYTWLDGGAGGEAVRLSEQVQPDKIKLLTPQEVAALGPAKIAALADVCVEWGPFADSERARALAELEPLAIGRLVSQKRVDPPPLWGAVLAPYSTRASADRRASELRQQNLRDVSVAEAAGKYVVAIGAFRTEEGATTYASELARLGVAIPTGTQRLPAVPQSMIVIRDPPANVVARLRELQSSWPNADTKVGSCDRA